MRQRSVIAISEGIHKVVEEALKKGAPMSQRRGLAAAEEEAKRLRIEKIQRERRDGFDRKTPKRKSIDNMQSDSVDYDNIQGGEFEEELPPIDKALVEFQAPMVEIQLNHMGSSLTGYSIMEEIHSDRMHGKLRPFVPGPIGACNNGPKPGPAPALKTSAQLKEDERTALHERQKRNDSKLAKLARKYR